MSLDVRIHPKAKLVDVPKLVVKNICNTETILKLLETAIKIAERTERSSRSDLVFQLHIQGSQISTGLKLNGRWILLTCLDSSDWNGARLLSTDWRRRSTSKRAFSHWPMWSQRCKTRQSTSNTATRSLARYCPILLVANRKKCDASRIELRRVAVFAEVRYSGESVPHRNSETKRTILHQSSTNCVLFERCLHSGKNFRLYVYILVVDTMISRSIANKLNLFIRRRIPFHYL